MPIVKDFFENEVEVTDLEADLMGSAEFQRLKMIRPFPRSLQRAWHYAVSGLAMVKRMERAINLRTKHRLGPDDAAFIRLALLCYHIADLPLRFTHAGSMTRQCRIAYFLEETTFGRILNQSAWGTRLSSFMLPQIGTSSSDPLRGFLIGSLSAPFLAAIEQDAKGFDIASMPVTMIELLGMDDVGLYVDAREQAGPVLLEQFAALTRVVTRKLYDPTLIAGTAMATGLLNAVLARVKNPPYPLFYQMHDKSMLELVEWHIKEEPFNEGQFHYAFDSYIRDSYFELYHLGPPLYLALYGNLNTQDVIETHNMCFKRGDYPNPASSIREVDLVQATDQHFTAELSKTLFQSEGKIFLPTLEPMESLGPIRVRTGQNRMIRFFPDNPKTFPRPVTAVVAINNLDPAGIYHLLPY
jgi:hypothetical protein